MLEEKKRLISAAAGRTEPDLVLKNVNEVEEIASTVDFVFTHRFPIHFFFHPSGTPSTTGTFLCPGNRRSTNHFLYNR